MLILAPLLEKDDEVGARANEHAGTEKTGPLIKTIGGERASLEGRSAVHPAQVPGVLWMVEAQS